MLSGLKQIQSAINPITFTPQEAGIFSNAKLTIFWKRIILTKLSDTTLKFLGEAISFVFLATSEKHPTDF